MEAIKKTATLGLSQISYWLEQLISVAGATLIRRAVRKPHQL